MVNGYISKADVLNLPQSIERNLCGEIVERSIDVKDVEALKPADVVQVVHGKWMKEDRGHVEYCAVCDQCGFDWMWSDRGYFKFCPNCGAKMDGKE